MCALPDKTPVRPLQLRDLTSPPATPESIARLATAVRLACARGVIVVACRAGTPALDEGGPELLSPAECSRLVRAGINTGRATVLRAIAPPCSGGGLAWAHIANRVRAVNPGVVALLGVTATHCDDFAPVARAIADLGGYGWLDGAFHTGDFLLDCHAMAVLAVVREERIEQRKLARALRPTSSGRTRSVR